jgi:predicted alpha/beta superfamily hydrolase
MKKIMVITLVCCVAWSGFAQVKRVEIPGSQIQKIYSSIVHQEYELQILLPDGYEKSTKKYPVVYLMDSQWDFPLLKSIYGEQYFDGFIPQLIVVGVTWGGAKPNPDSLRARDYTPTKENRLLQSGGADNFLSFIKTELIPYVEANFPADANNRTMVGCSLGGLITLYTLFKQPQLFRNYVAASPAYGWDNEVIYKIEQDYFERSSRPPARLYLSMGGVERGVPGFEKFVDHLKRRNYKSLQIGSRILENTGHSGTKAEGFTRGLQYAFERPAIKVAPELLNKYAGIYEFPNGNAIEIKVESDQLIVFFGGNNRQKLYAASETYFYSVNEFLNIRFTTGAVAGFELERYGGSQFAAKRR